MSKPRLSETLRQMAVTDSSRPETARLRDVFNDIEAALGAGVKRVKVLEALHADGFTMTMKSFESALYRIRKQRAQGTALKKEALPVPGQRVPTARPPRFEHTPTAPANILD